MPRNWPWSARAQDGETIAEQPEPIITPTSNNAVELSSRALEVQAGKAPSEQGEQQDRGEERTRGRTAGDPPLGERAAGRAGGEEAFPERRPSSAGDAEHVGSAARSCQELHQRAGQGERGAGAEAGGARGTGSARRSPATPRRCRSGGKHAQAAGAHRDQRGRDEGTADLQGRGYKPWPSKRTPIHAGDRGPGSRAALDAMRRVEQLGLQAPLRREAPAARRSSTP